MGLNGGLYFWRAAGMSIAAKRIFPPPPAPSGRLEERDATACVVILDSKRPFLALRRRSCEYLRAISPVGRRALAEAIPLRTTLKDVSKMRPSEHSVTFTPDAPTACGGSAKKL